MFFLGSRVLTCLDSERPVLNLTNDSGATAIEYGLIAAGIAVVNGLGTQLNTSFWPISKGRLYGGLFLWSGKERPSWRRSP